jgi:hypothetical protein
VKNIKEARKIVRLAKSGKTVEFWTSSSLWEVNWNGETEQFDLKRYSEWEGTEFFSNDTVEIVETLTTYTPLISGIRAF